MKKRVYALPGCLLLALAFVAAPARAGTFDAQGDLVFDPGAVFTDGFETGAAPDGASIMADPTAIEGANVLRIPSSGQVFLTLPTPKSDLSVSFSLFTRGGGTEFMVYAYYEEKGVPYSNAMLFPTGRVTSDGWVEMKSAPVSASFSRATSFYLAMYNTFGQNADVDGLEIVQEGHYREAQACAPPDASRCPAGDVCALGYCIQDDPYIPPLPQGEDRTNLPALVATDLFANFGGVVTRERGLPAALAALRAMPAATNAKDYWSGFASAIQLLHDSHSTQAAGFYAIDTIPICFVQGDADLSHRQAPSDPVYPDVLVSHGIPGQMGGLVPGDRLVAVNGMHPVAFARSLVGLASYNTHSSDPTEYEQNIERVRDDIRAFATTITVIHCDPATNTCAAPHDIPVSSLPTVSGPDAPVCDNRPAYHFASGNPDSVSHDTGNDVYYGPLAGTTSDEGFFGMLFDSLAPNPGPDPYQAPLADIVSEAKGVVIDRRTGNGGGFYYASEVSAPFLATNTLSVTVGPEPFVWARDWTAADGVSLFQGAEDVNPYTVGSASPKPGLKAAILVSRDVSADDFFAYGLRGGINQAPNVRSFGTKSCGAFGQFLELTYAGGALFFTFGNADTFAPDGAPLSGTGAEPDEHVIPTQSDLLAGRDTAYERALAWLRGSTSDTKGGH